MDTPTSVSTSGSITRKKAKDSSFDMQFKVLLLGDSGVGKTNLLTRYTQDEFSPTFITTIGIDYRSKVIDVDAGYRIKLQLWDTAGQERFRTITTSYFRGAQAVLLVFDVTDYKSFEHVENWASQIRDHTGPDIVLVVVGNKVDISEEDGRVISDDEAQQLAKKLGAPYLGTSAKDNLNVSEAFQEIAQACVTKELQSTDGDSTNRASGRRKRSTQGASSRGDVNINTKNKSQKNGCCSS